jgi:hypothetical protein
MVRGERATDWNHAEAYSQDEEFYSLCWSLSASDFSVISKGLNNSDSDLLFGKDKICGMNCFWQYCTFSCEDIIPFFGTRQIQTNHELHSKYWSSASGNRGLQVWPWELSFSIYLKNNQLIWAKILWLLPEELKNLYRWVMVRKISPRVSGYVFYLGWS